MSPCEDGYIAHMKKNYGVEMHNKSRFTLARLFEQVIKKSKYLFTQIIKYEYHL